MTRSLQLAALIFFLLLPACVGTPVTQEAKKTIEVDTQFGWQPFRPLYWESSVEITSFYKKMPTSVRSTLSIQKLQANDEFAAAARGSGVVIGIEGDWLTILTAKHVINGADAVFVSDGNYEAKAVDWHAQSDKEDIGLITVQSPILSQSVKAVEVAQNTPEIGSIVWTVGNALGGGKVPSFGPIQAPPCRVLDGTYARGGYLALPGNSGGPIFYDGKCVGVVSAILINPRTGQLYSHMGFFVAAETIQLFLNPVKVGSNG